MWKHYYTVSSIEDALEILENEKEHARIIAGGTDLVLELKNGMHPGVHTLIDITRVEGLDRIWIEEENIKFGPALTHNQCLVSKELLRFGFPLIRAAYSVGAPQIKNIGTVVGNLVTASPANDTITPLIAMGAIVKIRSKNNEYQVKLADFYKGVRKTVLQPDEMVVEVQFPKLEDNQCGAFQKYILRETHAISVANVCAILTMDGDMISKAVVTLGAVAPTIIRSRNAEKVLIGSALCEEIINKASTSSERDAKPIDDIRATEKYRNHIIPVLLKDALNSIKDKTWNKFDNDPVLLWGKKKNFFSPVKKTYNHDNSTELQVKVNGEDKVFKHGQNQTLLALIREQAKLTGSKDGCGEGECGACTMHINGLPVFTCLIPAPKAHLNEVSTIEGLAKDGVINDVQQAFIDAGAVQCGYCTPGFIMSAVKLIEEKPYPTEMDIKQGLSGNICRCTGYYSIINAVEMAAERIKSK